MEERYGYGDRKTLTNEEVIRELLEMLKQNTMKEQANGVYELCAYVDSMTHKVEDMTEEIARLCEDIQKMKDDTFTNRFKKSLSEAADRLEKCCEEIKQQIFEVKVSIKNRQVYLYGNGRWRCCYAGSGK